MDESDELPTVPEVHNTHRHVEEEFDLKYRGLRDRFADRKIQNVIERCRGYDGVYLRAGVLIKDLVNIHVYKDGNKRTAWLVAMDYLEQRDREPDRDPATIEMVMKRVSRFEYGELGNWLENGIIDHSKLQ